MDPLRARDQNRPIGVSVVAVLMVVWALGWLGFCRRVLPEDLLASGITAFLALGTLAVAFGLWNMRRWALHGYVCWALLYVVALTVLDARSEPVWWKVIAGMLVVGLLPGIAGLYLRATFGYRTVQSRPKKP